MHEGEQGWIKAIMDEVLGPHTEDLAADFPLFEVSLPGHGHRDKTPALS
jgi:hypothetical protein